MKKSDAWIWILFAGLVLLAGGGTAAEVVMLNELERRVQKLADAIQDAEGYNVPGSRAQRNHNPGDLESDITGAGIGFDGPYVIYANYVDGRAALEHQARLMLENRSHIYNSWMSIAEMASHYTATEREAWARNVADFLGVDVSTPLEQIPV